MIPALSYAQQLLVLPTHKLHSSQIRVCPPRRPHQAPRARQYQLLARQMRASGCSAARPPRATSSSSAASPRGRYRLPYSLTSQRSLVGQSKREITGKRERLIINRNYRIPLQYHWRLRGRCTQCWRETRTWQGIVPRGDRGPSS